MTDDQNLSVLSIISRRQISEVVHFTTTLGFLGCLATGEVMPRRRLRDEQLLEQILTLNAPFRAEEEAWFDRSHDWAGYINLSISEITTNLFRHSLKWHDGKDISWVIMSFAPTLMADEGVFFSTTNNIYPLTKRAQGPQGLESLFALKVPRKTGWVANRGTRASNLTTCEQAEVLYPMGLSMSYLRKVYVRTGDDADWAYAMLRTYEKDDVAVIHDEVRFRGARN